jgi:Tfp pilus assembly protein PilV
MGIPSSTTERWRGGFTLIESLLAGVVLAIVAVGISSTLAASYQHTVVLNQTATAVSLARQLLEEIAAQPFTAPVSTAKTTARSTFAGTGDYNLYTDNGSNLTTLGGASINATGGMSFTRSVSVQTGAVPAGIQAPTSSDFEVVTVTVKTPSGTSVSLQRVVTNYTLTR